MERVVWGPGSGARASRARVARVGPSSGAGRFVGLAVGTEPVLAFRSGRSLPADALHCGPSTRASGVVTRTGSQTTDRAGWAHPDRVGHLAPVQTDRAGSPERMQGRTEVAEHEQSEPERGEPTRRRDRRADLLVAAARRFVAVGISKTTMEDIAREARAGKATLYRHFGNKAAVVDALLEREAARFEHELRAAAAERQDAVGRIEAVFVTGVGFFITHPILTKGRDEEPGLLLPRITAHGGPLVERGLDLFTELVEAGIADQELREVGRPSCCRDDHAARRRATSPSPRCTCRSTIPSRRATSPTHWWQGGSAPGRARPDRPSGVSW